MTYHRIDNDSDGNLLRFYYHKKKENRVSKFDFRNFLKFFLKNTISILKKAILTLHPQE